MVNENRDPPGGGAAAMLAAMGQMAGMVGLPSPQAIFGELRRLNVNIEHVTPSIHSLASCAESVNTLAAKLDGIDVPR